MKNLSLKQWADIYVAKTGDEIGLLPGFRTYYLPNRGFACMKVDYESKMVIIDKVSGDGKFWRDMAEVCMAQANDLDVIATTCTRNLLSYMRNFDAELLDTEIVEHPFSNKYGKGLYRYLFQDSIGRAVLVSPRCQKENGEAEYWVTQYLKVKARPTIKEFLESQVGERNVENQNNTSL